MPTRPRARCTRCRQLHGGTGRCSTCSLEAQQHSDRMRGTATQRGYGGQHRSRFRPGVLARDPLCVLCRAAASVVADHWPISRRELLARGMDPDDPTHGRGLCGDCHNRETARNQPGGWHRPHAGDEAR